jgi:predicted lipid carrier protein YhbT
VASEQECEAALQRLASQLAELDPESRRKHVVERTVCCRVKDLDLSFSGRLTGEGLQDMAQTDDGATAQVRLTVGSDDLVALTEGRLGFGTALATGKLRIDASVLDLIRLRSLL